MQIYRIETSRRLIKDQVDAIIKSEDNSAQAASKWNIANNITEIGAGVNIKNFFGSGNAGR